VKPATATGMRNRSAMNDHSSGPITVATWPGATRPSKPASPDSNSSATAGQVRRQAVSKSRLSGNPSATRAATGAVVVSKPAAKKTTVRAGSARAIVLASAGEAMGRTSPPRPRASSRERASPFATFTGTRSMSPKATSTTPSSRARWIAW